jgi:hypothetical protein
VVGGTLSSRGRSSLLAVAWCVWACVQPQTRQFCVTVMDDDRKAVTGLGAEDFALKDGGARQPVVDSEHADDPMQIAIVIAGFPAEDRAPLATAVNAFASAVHASSPLSHAVLVLEGTALDWASRALLSGARPVDHQVVVSGDHGVAAILNTAVAELGSGRATGRRVIVAFLYPSASQAGPVVELPSLIQSRKIALWTVELAPGRTTDAKSPPDPDAGSEALDLAVQAGGGLRWRIDTPAGLETGARGVAALLGTAQYVVTVELPVLFNGPVPIATRHDRGVVLVPMWSR